MWGFLANQSLAPSQATGPWRLRVGPPRKIRLFKFNTRGNGDCEGRTASSADLEEGDDDIDDEDDDDDQDDDDDDVGNDGPLTRPSRNDGQGTFLGHGSVERGLEQRVGNRFAEV